MSDAGDESAPQGADAADSAVGALATDHALICAVSDRSRLAGPTAGLDGLVGRLADAAAADVDLVQVREPDLAARDLIALVERVVAATRGTAARVIVNDRLDVAVAAGAHGVHLKSESMETAAARQLAPAGFLVGRSVHAPDEAERAAQDGADYVIVGTIFETASKPGRPAGSGLPMLRDAVARCRVPVLAIGGVTAARAGEVAATGAAGIAAIGLFMAPGGAEAGAAGQATDRAGLEATVAAIRRAFELGSPAHARPGGKERPWR